MIRIVSWNVNGVRAVAKKGLFEFLSGESPDVLCLQETKAEPGQLGKEFFGAPDGAGALYHTYWASAKRRGYSGVAMYAKTEPRSTRFLDVSEFDDEGRVLEADFGEFILICAYFPNSQDAGARLGYKLGFCDAILSRCDEIVRSGRRLVLCGDYNIAHTPMDLTYPKANEGNAGYLPEERSWMTKFLDSGYADTFRRICPDPGNYTWWSYRMRAREKDIGWRLDYHCVDEATMPFVRSSRIMKNVMGSDHCPVALELDLALP